MDPQRKSDPAGQPQELMDIWARKSDKHIRKKELLQIQCDMEANINDLARRKVELSARIDASVGSHSAIKSELRKIEKEELSLKKEAADLEQKINGIIKDIELLERREAEKQREIDEIKQGKAQIKDQRDDLVKKRTGAAAAVEEMAKKRLALEEKRTQCAEEQASLQKELEDIEKDEESHKAETAKIEKELAGIKEDIAELDEKERALMKAIEKNKNLPSEFMNVLTTHVNAVDKGELPEGMEKDLADAGKRNAERVEELKNTLEIIDCLVEKLPMTVKKQFCSSRCFTEYEKLHKVVFAYEGTPVQKKYVREHAKWVLSEIDKFLGKLPEKDIDKFLSSRDFEAYSKTLEAYGIES